MKRFLFSVFAILFLLQFCFAYSYEALPKVIEIKAALVGEQVTCSAQIYDHATSEYFGEEFFENNYSAALVDSSGGKLSEYEFVFDVDNIHGEHGTGQDEIPISRILAPYVDSVAAVVIYDPQGTEVCRVDRSANNPEITITYPADGGDWTHVDKIEWEISDPDSEDWLLVDVYWATNLNYGWILWDKQVDSDSIELSHPLKATRIMVIVCDGFNVDTVIVESSHAEGDVTENLIFAESQVTGRVNEDNIISDDESSFFPPTPFVPDNGNGPVEFDFWDLLIYGVAGLIILVVILIIYFAIKGGKKKPEKKTTVKVAEPKKSEVKQAVKEIKQEVQKQPSAEKPLTKKEYSDSMKLLRKRYATGEITTEQFKEMKKELEQ